MTNSEYKLIEAQITQDMCKRFPEVIMSTEEAAEALKTNRHNLGENNSYNLKVIKNHGRGFHYLRPQVIKAVVEKTLNS